MEKTLKTILLLSESLFHTTVEEKKQHSVIFKLWSKRFLRLAEKDVQDFIALFYEKMDAFIKEKEGLDTKYSKDKLDKNNSSNHVTLLEVIHLPTYEMDDKTGYHEDFAEIVKTKYKTEFDELEKALQIETIIPIPDINVVELPKNANDLLVERIEQFVQI